MLYGVWLLLRSYRARETEFDVIISRRRDRQRTSAPTTTNVEVRAAPTAVAGVPVENVIAMTEADATWRSAESGDHAMVCMGITGGALNAAASTRDADTNVFINCPLLADDAASYSTSCCHNVNSVVNNDTPKFVGTVRSWSGGGIRDARITKPHPSWLYAPPLPRCNYLHRCSGPLRLTSKRGGFWLCESSCGAEAVKKKGGKKLIWC